jgi:hypothetical protein
MNSQLHTVWGILWPKFTYSYKIHLPKFTEVRNTNSNRGLLGCDTMLCCGRIPTFRRSMLPTSSPWRQHVPPKRWYPTITPHGVITHKTSTWIFTAVKTSNLTLKIQRLKRFENSGQHCSAVKLQYVLDVVPDLIHFWHEEGFIQKTERKYLWLAHWHTITKLHILQYMTHWMKSLAFCFHL